MAEILDTREMKYHLQKEELKQIYLFYGPESYLKDLYIERISERLNVDEMNRYFFAGDVDVGEIESICSEMSMFGEKKLVIVSGSGFFKPPKEEENEGDDKKKERASSKNCDFIKTIAESDAHVIFVEDEADKRNKVYKETLKYGIVFQCKRQGAAEIKGTLLHIVKKSGRIVSDYVLQYMIEGMGDDINKLIHEIEKLILYVPEGSEITKENVDEVCRLQNTHKIYELNNAIIQGQKTKAYKIMRDLLEEKEPPIKLIVMISKMWSQLYSMKKLSEENANNYEIARLLEISDKAVPVIKKQAAEFSFEYIKDKIKQCEEMDESIKSGKIKDSVALEILTIG